MVATNPSAASRCRQRAALLRRLANLSRNAIPTGLANWVE